MSFRKLVPLIALLAVFTMALRFSIGADTYWHLKAGDWILSTGSLPNPDPFSLTRLGSEWIYPGWLAQIALISVYKLLGFPGLNLLTALLVTAAFGFVWQTMREGPLLRAFVLLLAATVSAVYWSARPHIFTFLFTAVTLWILAKFRRERGSRVIWLIPALTTIWANTHGGFVIPVLLLGLEIAATIYSLLLPKLRIATHQKWVREELSATGDQMIEAGGDGSNSEKEIRGGVHASDEDRQLVVERLKMLLAATLAAVVAIVVNPFGLDMLAYPLRTVSIGVLRDFIQEWQSPNFHQLEIQPFLWMLLLALAAMAMSPKRPKAIELIHIGIFTYMGFLAARNIALFALVAAPVLSRHADAILMRWLPGRRGGQELSPRLTRSLNAVLLALIGLAVLIKSAVPLSTQFNEETIGESMPAGAVEYLRTNQPRGPLLNSYNWGGYVIWSLYPRYLSFVDGRTDLFDDAILEEYLDVWRGNDGWQEALDRWDIQLVLIEKDAPLARELLRGGWNEGFADDQARVFTAPD
ncbi:MAG: hypothetical protein ACE5JF_05140 [Anaerolineales bacterium]